MEEAHWDTYDIPERSLRQIQKGSDPYHNSIAIRTVYTLECQICGHQYQTEDGLETCPEYDTHKGIIEEKQSHNYALFNLPIYEGYEVEDLNKSSVRAKILEYTEKGIRLAVEWNRRGDTADVWMPRRYVDVFCARLGTELKPEHIGQVTIISLEGWARGWARDILDKKVKEVLGDRAFENTVLETDSYTGDRWFRKTDPKKGY